MGCSRRYINLQLKINGEKFDDGFNQKTQKYSIIKVEMWMDGRCWIHRPP
jgi:hypothetical protein